jgi:predicted nucleotidyltransferase
MDDFNRFLALLHELHRERVEYVLVGGVAVNLHGLPRTTQDIDLFVRPDPENVERLKRALRAVWDDPDIDEIAMEDLTGDYPTVRYGPPEDDFVVDIITRLGTAFRYEDLEFAEVDVEGVRVRLATPQTLVRMKQDTVRPIDKDDVARLREHLDLEED